MKLAGLMAGAAALALAGGAFAQAGGSSGTATYWMTADTVSGMGAMAQGGGRAMLGAMLGRGGGMGGAMKTLRLQLGSSGRPAGAPTAEHLPPALLGAGASLPLVSPQGAVAADPTPGALPPNMERPRGRILIYWGCGEHARPGQPVVIDFATLSAGKAPAAFANSNIRYQTPPNPSAFATYGEWPNQRSQTRVPSNASLVGEHVVRGNYSPEIRFTLAPGQDFLAPVTLTSQTASASGSVPLVWQPISGARAWFATAMGAAANGDMVMWSSSETQMTPGIDYLPESEVARLIQQRVLLPASADRCTVPAEVAKAGQGQMLMLTALGAQADFSHPARPARAPASWKPQWTVKLRTKSTYMGLLGMDMGAMSGGGDQGQANDGEPPKKKKKRSILDNIGGMIPH